MITIERKREILIKISDLLRELAQPTVLPTATASKQLPLIEVPPAPKAKEERRINGNKLYTVAEIAEKLRLKEHQVRTLVRNGSIEAIQKVKGGHIDITRKAYLEYKNTVKP